MLLGSSETAGEAEGGFEVISKSERIYRHIGRSRPGELAFSVPGRPRAHFRSPVARPAGLACKAVLADFCRRLVLESMRRRRSWSIANMSASIPWDRRTAICASRPAAPPMICWRWRTRTSEQSSGPRSSRPQEKRAHRRRRRPNQPRRQRRFRSDRHPAGTSEGEPLLLICFIDEAAHEPAARPSASRTRRAAGRRARAGTRSHASGAPGAIRNLEISSEEQQAINEEALSVKEEFQSTNEELLTSKEELQSLNEELTALNSQLRKPWRSSGRHPTICKMCFTAPMSRRFSSTPSLKIRFFTPATSRCSMSFPAMSAGRSRISTRWPPMTLVDRCENGPADPGAGRARDRSAERRLVYPPHTCPTEPRTIGSKASSSHSPISPSERRPPTPWGRRNGRRSRPMSRSRVFSPPPAMISASRCKHLCCCKGY